MAEPVLFIAYQFPPAGGVGTMRSLNFVKHLRDFGYEPIVLTITEENIRDGGFPQDPGLFEQLPEGIEVYRASNREPRKFRARLQKLRLYRLAWFFLYPMLWEYAARWPGSAYPLAKKLIQERNIKLVYTTSSPFAALPLGARLRRNLPVQWIADIRDPFTDGYGVPFPSKVHWHLARYMEKKTISKADKVLVTSPGYIPLLVDRGLTQKDKIEVVYNGF